MGRGTAADEATSIRVAFGENGGTTALAARGAERLVIRRERGWIFDAFMVYVRANMDDPQGMSTSLVAKSPGSIAGSRGKEGVGGRDMWPPDGECC